MKYTVDQIRTRYNSGEPMEFIFFWGHSAPAGVIKKACLSQWYPCDFHLDGVDYHTTEQYMMAQKALLFRDEEVYAQIMTADNPKAYKALGRAIRGFEKKIWDTHKYNIVVRGNVAKFSQNLALKDFLLNTGDKVLVEASPYDGIWGIGRGLDDPEVSNPNLWRGENLLGLALMDVRDRLRGE